MAESEPGFHKPLRSLNSFMQTFTVLAKASAIAVPDITICLPFAESSKLQWPCYWQKYGVFEEYKTMAGHNLIRRYAMPENQIN
jgi:hypothetical protein